MGGSTTTAENVFDQLTNITTNVINSNIRSESNNIKNVQEIKIGNVIGNINIRNVDFKQTAKLIVKSYVANENINSIYELNDFHYIDDYASFNLTTLTLASILNLNRIVEVGDNISNYNHNKILFPKSLSKINFKTFQQPKLLKLLDKLDYEFIWIGNNWGNCSNYNESLCLNKNFLAIFYLN